MSAACYTYVSEISLPNYRGFLQALGPISASFGILFTYTAGFYFKWNVVALLSTSFGIFTLISMQFLPESPAKLYNSGKREECLKSLEWFRQNPLQARKEYDNLNDNDNMINNNNKVTDDNNKNLVHHTKKEYMLSTNAIRPFFLLVTLFLLQALSGIYSILFYAVNFFRDSDIVMDENLSTIIFAAIRLIMSIIGAILINFYGRRTLLISSSGGMALSLLIAFVYNKYYEYHPLKVEIFTNIRLICIFTYVLFTMIGMLPIPWILVGELFPLKIRSIMSGIVICIAQCFIFICVKLYPYMIDKLEFSGTIFLFFIGTFLTMIVCKLFLPETKNKTLEEIEQYFTSNDNNTKTTTTPIKSNNDVINNDGSGSNRDVIYVNNISKSKYIEEVPKENLNGLYKVNLTI